MTSRRRTGEMDPSDLDQLLDAEEDPTAVRRASGSRRSRPGSYPPAGPPPGAEPLAPPPGLPRNTVTGYRGAQVPTHPGAQMPVRMSGQMPVPVYPPAMVAPVVQQQPEQDGVRVSLPGLILLVLALLTIGAVLAVVIVKVMVPQGQKTILVPTSSAPSTVVTPMPSMPQQPAAGQQQPVPQAAPIPSHSQKRTKKAPSAEDNAPEEQPEQEEQAAPAPPPKPEKPKKQEGWPDPFSAE